VPKRTGGWRGIPDHSHQYFLGPFLMAVEKRALQSSPPTITVFAVCVRTVTLQVGKPFKPGGGTRSGG
jgi:hypothetical protein